jgi:hypothetical protein
MEKLGHEPGEKDESCDEVGENELMEIRVFWGG